MATQTHFPLPAGQWVEIRKANPARNGLTFCNPDAANTLVISVVGPLTVQVGGANPLAGIPLVPNEKWLMDVATSREEIWAYSALGNNLTVIEL